MKYSPKFFKDTLPEWKRKKDSLVARYIHRPISFYFSSLFALLGWTPNHVSFLSLIVAIIACACFLPARREWHLIGALLVNLWSVLDSADGNMARSLGGLPYGEFIDATSSYVLVGFMFPAIAVTVFRTGGLLFQAGNFWIIYLGALASSCDTMMRLFLQKAKNTAYESKCEKGEATMSSTIRSGRIAKLQERIDSELGLGGWNMIAIVICTLTRSLDLYVLFYALFYSIQFVASAVYLIRKTGCLKRKLT